MSRGKQWWQSPWVGLILVVIVAALLRYPMLDAVPPGLNFDEGGEGVAALDVTQGVFRIWWPIGGGKEPLMAYLVQPFFWLFGPTRLALRLYTATLGVIAAVGVYWLGWEMFAAGRGRDKPRSSTYSMVPLAAGLGLATAFWHVAFSRIAFRALSMPAVEGLALAWLWRALRRSDEAGRERWLDFVGAGAFIGLGAYSYLAGRFVPVALAFFFATEAVLSAAKGRRPWVLRHWQGLAVSVGVALLVFSPLALYFIGHPEAFVERAGSVSIFSPNWNQGDFWGALWQTTTTTVGSWAGLTGDPNPLGNLPGRPMLSLPLALLFWIGAAAAIWRIVTYLRSRSWMGEPSQEERFGSYLFLLCVWLVMLLPGVLAPEGSPHHLRLIGTAPATYLLVAVGLRQVAVWVVSALGGQGRMRAVEKGGSRLGRALLNTPLLPLLVFLPIGAVTANAYFSRWTQLPDLYMAYDVYAVELAEHMTDDSDPSNAYVIPMDLRAAHEARHYSLDFLYQGQEPYFYIPVDEATVENLLTQAAAGRETLQVVRWTQDKHVGADERELVDFLLTRFAEKQEDEFYPVYHIESWTLPSTETEFDLPDTWANIGAVYEDLLGLEAVSVETGKERVFVGLRWIPLNDMDTDYKVSVRLVASNGDGVLQKDRFLQHNWHQGTSLWPSEAVNEYYVLGPVPAGEYEVRVLVYHPDTLNPLIASGAAEVPVGRIQVP